jgi:type I restriction-modification system DNA methylase subunit
MAKHSNKKSDASVLSKSTFADCMFALGSRFSLSKVFEDFLTMAICACSYNPVTKLSNYEEEYLEIVKTYKDSELRHEFSKAFACLCIEMEDQFHAELGNDVLGSFFEQHLSNGRNGQFFTPFPVCTMMASCVNTDGTTVTGEPLRIIDPCCGSGRMLIASHRVKNVGKNEYYGIDIDHTCVKMAALNLFLNGMFGSEVMCANALMPNDFVISYRISLLPFGVFKITDKEKSSLWQRHNSSFVFKEKLSSSIVLDSTPFRERKNNNGEQLGLF